MAYNIDRNARCAVVGHGSWATALVKILLENERNVGWYIRNRDVLEHVRKHGTNPRYLRDVRFDPGSLHLSDSLDEVARDAEIVVLAAPSVYLKTTLEPLTEPLGDKFIVSAIKGIVPDDLITVAEYVNRRYDVPFDQIGIVSGPCHAEEVALERLSYLTVVCKTLENSRILGDKIRTDYINVGHSTDIYGIEYAYFTQDDAHIFMMPEQIRDEIKGVVALIDEVYSLFGFKYHVELSTRPENSMGTDEDWELATEGLRGALNDLGLDYVVNEGDGAFYGPKIDFHLTDSIGRTWQCGTIQLDMQLPQRFELEYTGADGEKHRPIMIHRVAFGSIERFIGILIEHFAGAFPTWLAPVQVKVLPISDKYMDYANKVLDELNAAGVRAEVDSRAEKIGYKIREAQMQKIPYMLVVGEKEQEADLVSVRSRFAGDEGQKNLETFIADIQKEIADRVKREVVKEDEK